MTNKEAESNIAEGVFTELPTQVNKTSDAKTKNETRLEELKKEHAKGVDMLEGMQKQADNILKNMTRIEGAIAMLNELEKVNEPVTSETK